MIQIAFEPAFDPFHAAFRMLRQILFRPDNILAIARMKILDVYVAEPDRCTDIRLPGDLKKAARSAAECQPPFYGKRPTAISLFNRMSPMQDAAVQTLVLRGILDSDAFSRGYAAPTNLSLPSALVSRISYINEKQVALMNFLCRDLDALDFDGAKGLKDRTGLAEYRYDIL